MADKAASDSRTSPASSERIKPSTEDPDTAATRKEFDNAQISEKPALAAMSAEATAQPDPAPETVPSGGDGDKAVQGEEAVELEISDTENDKMKERISSPKKKRAHDEVDQNKDSLQDPNGDVSPIGTNGTAASGRNNRSEPEKKRHRDTSTEAQESTTGNPSETLEPEKIASTETSKKETQTDSQPAGAKAATTSTSAFQSSGLAGFASSSSPFLQGGTPALSSFASAQYSASPFGSGSAIASKSETPSVFGGGSLANGSSPFGQLSGAPKTFGGASKPFGGSVFGGGFSSGIGAMGGNNLTSFAKPGESFKSTKPARAFGAPDSDAESDGDEDGPDGDSNEGDEEKQDKEDKEAESDKKKTKLQRVEVDDGEAGEVTMLQVRAKIYHLDKTVTPMAWKERGAGNLKINVPEACVDLDQAGTPILGSFDASSLEDADNKTIRLVMRQDSTHRLLLNTAIIPAMQFQEKSTNKATCILFTAIEGEVGAVSVQLKLNPANAKSFLNEVGKIQHELQSS